MMRSFISRVLCALFAVMAVAFVVTSTASAAGAVPAISQPAGHPYVVKLDAQGKPVSFTIVATGFPAGSLVYVEQCDANPPSAPHWLPTRNCDIGSSPAAAIVDSSGNARFPAGDLNHGFQPFIGLGPEGLFNCLAPSAAAPKDGVPEYRSCQIRVSSNNNQATTDQVFLPIAFGVGSDPATSKSATGKSAAATAAPHSSSSSSTGLVIGGIVALIAVIGLLAVFAVRRRTPARSA